MNNALDRAKAGFEQQKKKTPIIREVERGTPVRRSSGGGGSRSGPIIDVSTPEEKFTEFVNDKPVVEEVRKGLQSTPKPLVKYKEGVVLKESQTVKITFETPSGDISTRGSSGGKLSSDIGSLEKSGYRIIRVTSLGSQGVIYETETSKNYSSRVMSDLSSKYVKHGYIPKGVYENIKKNMPDEFKNTGFSDEYTKIVYGKTLGIDTTKKEQEFIKKYSESVMTREWAMEQFYTNPLTGETGTYKQLRSKEPALFLQKNKEGNWYIKSDIGKAMQLEDAKHSWTDLNYWGGKALATIFSPELVNVARESLVGSGEIKQIHHHYTIGQYEYLKAYKSGDWGKGFERFVSSPLPIMVATAGINAGLSAFSQTARGGQILFTIPKLGVPVSTHGFAGAAVGGAFAGYTLFELGQSKTQQELDVKLQNIAIMTPVIIGSASVGHSFGVRIAPKLSRTYGGMKTTFKDLTNKYTPNVLKEPRRFVQYHSDVNIYRGFGKTNIKNIVLKPYHSFKQKIIDFKYPNYDYEPGSSRVMSTKESGAMRATKYSTTWDQIRNYDPGKDVSAKWDYYYYNLADEFRLPHPIPKPETLRPYYKQIGNVITPDRIDLLMTGDVKYSFMTFRKEPIYKLTHQHKETFPQVETGKYPREFTQLKGDIYIKTFQGDRTVFFKHSKSNEFMLGITPEGKIFTNRGGNYAAIQNEIIKTTSSSGGSLSQDFGFMGSGRTNVRGGGYKYLQFLEEGIDSGRHSIWDSKISSLQGKKVNVIPSINIGNINKNIPMIKQNVELKPDTNVFNILQPKIDIKTNIRQDMGLSNIPLITPISTLKIGQELEQRQQQKQELKLELNLVKIPTPKIPRQHRDYDYSFGPTPPVEPSPPKIIRFEEPQFGNGKKKKKKKEIYGYGIISHRYRLHKTPTISLSKPKKSKRGFLF